MSTEERLLKVDRELLDEIDEKILELIEDRSRVVRNIQNAKRTAGVSTRDYEREMQILERVSEGNAGLYPNECVRQVFQALLFHAPATRDAG